MIATAIAVCDWVSVQVEEIASDCGCHATVQEAAKWGVAEWSLSDASASADFRAVFNEATHRQLLRKVPDTPRIVRLPIVRSGKSSAPVLC